MKRKRFTEEQIIGVLKDLASKKMVTPGAKREAVAYAREHHGMSERQACALVGVSRRVIRYQPNKPDDALLRQPLRELAAERRRFGYRRLGYLLAREGHGAQPQEAAAYLPRRRAAGVSPWRTQAGSGHTGPDGAARWTEPAVVARFRL